ncbi:MAG TPA: bifunctional 2-C-methyl-D-erythritol 4-phosphate cytidylyltransferase/2-C-methyl-D-erythritol 2,4-cyclodiphosphate synthase [Azospirillaceae bacterium]|nr:bifunctional 2-C-methyl-D-erythritol 4-phosphate cytidylyltransferase/2-C-methyl-D-erythritol 2,4-cyclodiphosphate synthase [Azospirillaceae bacterium]
MTRPGTVRTTALVVAAGTGQRFGGDVPKQYMRLGGRPILRRTVEALAACPDVSDILVVVHPDHGDLYATAVDGLDLPPPVSGGDTRQISVRNGLERLAAEAAPPDRVLIHDAARPLIDPGTVARVVAALDEGPAALAAAPVVDTLKRGRDGMVAGTVDRAGLWQAQTPQGFHLDAILDAHRRFPDLGATDDAALAEAAGLPVRLVPGTPDNFKVTTMADLARAERLLGGGEYRTGLGYDVHRFGPGDHVVLCGVRVPHDRGVVAHSDGDVAFHAITDALLGTIGAGDIGTHFPPSDERWRGADSGQFVRHAAALVAAAGGTLVHVDVSIVCERPKIGPHRAAMLAWLGELLGLPADRIGLKATTSEGLGFTGRREGLAAQAIVTVRFN